MGKHVLHDSRFGYAAMDEAAEFFGRAAGDFGREYL
jgi:hypothetical protein